MCIRDRAQVKGVARAANFSAIFGNNPLLMSARQTDTGSRTDTAQFDGKYIYSISEDLATGNQSVVILSLIHIWYHSHWCDCTHFIVSAYSANTAPLVTAENPSAPTDRTLRSGGCSRASCIIPGTASHQPTAL